jgi:hypothetical protein
MEMTGTLSEFPLPELLQLLDQRRLTGCLSVDIFSDYYAELRPQNYVIWLEQGHVASVQRGDCPQDIYTLAVHQDWISPYVAQRLKARSPQDKSAGSYLESQGVLNFEQLRSLFFKEVVHRVEALCTVSNAMFQFQTTDTLPLQTMTGFRIPATKLAKQGFWGSSSRFSRLESLESPRHENVLSRI